MRGGKDKGPQEEGKEVVAQVNVKYRLIEEQL